MLALQTTVFFDHCCSHHHHFLYVFRIPFRLTWTHKVQACIPGYVGSLNTALFFCASRAAHLRMHTSLRVFVCLPTSLFSAWLSFKLFCHRLVAAYHLIPCCPSNRRGAKVFQNFIHTDTDIAADMHEINGGEKIGLRQMCAEHRTFALRRNFNFEPENAGTSLNSQNKCIPNLGCGIATEVLHGGGGNKARIHEKSVKFCTPCSATVSVPCWYRGNESSDAGCCDCVPSTIQAQIRFHVRSLCEAT